MADKFWKKKKKKKTQTDIHISVWKPSGHLKISKLGPVVQDLTKLLANETLKLLFRNMTNTLIFFAEKKMWVAFGMQKLLTVLQ